MAAEAVRTPSSPRLTHAFTHNTGTKGETLLTLSRFLFADNFLVTSHVPPATRFSHLVGSRAMFHLRHVSVTSLGHEPCSTCDTFQSPRWSRAMFHLEHISCTSR